jgi:hypothetical protein
MLNEDNQIHNFISSSGFGTVINYGSGSDFPTFFQITVPVPIVKKLRFLRFHNTGTQDIRNSVVEPRSWKFKSPQHYFNMFSYFFFHS